MLVAAFNDEDPGVDQIAQRCKHLFWCFCLCWTNEIPIVFGLPPVFVAAALAGDVGIQEIQGLECNVRIVLCGTYSVLILRV